MRVAAERADGEEAGARYLVCDEATAYYVADGLEDNRVQVLAEGGAQVLDSPSAHGLCLPGLLCRLLQDVDSYCQRQGPQLHHKPAMLAPGGGYVAGGDQHHHVL